MYKKLLKKFNRWMDYNPPGSLSTKGWRYFKYEFKKNAKIRYWFKHSFRRRYILPIKWKYTAIADWIRYRTYDRYHVLKTGLKPAYYDIDTTMLHVNFNILKDFVEVEQAWSQYLWSGEYKKNVTWLEKYVPFYRKFKPFRRPDIGIKHLEWASTLDDPSLPPSEQSPLQAQAAREIHFLYNWWVNVYPNRKEPEYIRYDSQGLGMFGCLDPDFDRSAADFVEHMKGMEESEKVRNEWEEEDTEMLIRLVKIRKQLWT